MTGKRIKAALRCLALLFLLFSFETSASAVDPVLIAKIIPEAASVTVLVGKTMTVKAQIEPRNATSRKFEWFSSDERILTVNNGKMKGIAPGKATITVKTVDAGGANTEIKENVYVGCNCGGKRHFWNLDEI